MEEEVSAAADPALSEVAMNMAKNMTYQQGHTQRETYVNVRFMPPPVAEVTAGQQ